MYNVVGNCTVKVVHDLMLCHFKSIFFATYQTDNSVNCLNISKIKCSYFFLIFKSQDVAEVALHHCVHREYTETEKGGSEVSKIEYSFEFLDDFMTPVPTMSMYLNMLPWRKTNQANQFEDTMDRDSARDVPLKPIPTVQGPPYLAVSSPVDSFENPINGCEGEESWLQEKFDPQNHPLELMVCGYMC